MSAGGGKLTSCAMDYGPDDEVASDLPDPPFRQLAEILAARIERGDWRPGRAMPSESQLMGEYGLARTTVRKSIAVLVKSGLVFTVPHRGTYVAENDERPRRG